ncbi:MAG: phosphoribosylformylglycinamidine cyclo-ligase [Dehalococcoidia bacterium]|nr:phosphoribosylformylglycinamidine cyclo-ligase [Dehalococcoidia bacterium]
MDKDNSVGSESAYSEAGVDTAGEERAMTGLLGWINKTLELRRGIGEAKLPIGFFANVVDIGHGMGLAFSTDGVGTKILIAEMMGKYDTVGIDCIAMNVNDILCVGAEPISLVDYIAVQEADPYMLSEIAKGLYTGAKLSRITIPGGELAQLKDIVKGAVEGKGFDLVGTCIGMVPLDKIIVGDHLVPGDAVVGLRSSGIHSNGLTLAREVFFNRGGHRLEEIFPEFGRSLGEELLEPTHIYVAEVLDMLRAGLNVKSLAHITSDGLTNLTRVTTDVGFVLDFLPAPLPIFDVIQRVGKVGDEEMFQVFNMGIGFCLTVPEAEVQKVIDIAAGHGVQGYRLGRVVADPERKVIIEPRGLISKGNNFYKA